MRDAWRRAPQAPDDGKKEEGGGFAHSLFQPLKISGNAFRDHVMAELVRKLESGLIPTPGINIEENKLAHFVTDRILVGVTDHHAEALLLDIRKCGVERGSDGIEHADKAVAVGRIGRDESECPMREKAVVRIRKTGHNSTPFLI